MGIYVQTYRCMLGTAGATHLLLEADRAAKAAAWLLRIAAGRTTRAIDDMV